jgi:outer membrane protein
MRKMDLFILRIVLIVLLVSIPPCVVQAQQAVKIGFVNVEEILATSDIGKSAKEDFKKLFEKNKKTIQDKEQELQKLKDDLEKQRPILKEDVFRDKELSYQKKYRDYQDLVKDANEELNTRRQDMANKYVPEIMKIVNTIGEKEKYAMIVDLSTVPLTYYNKEYSITKRVIEEFNKILKQKK